MRAYSCYLPGALPVAFEMVHGCPSLSPALYCPPHLAVLGHILHKRQPIDGIIDEGVPEGGKKPSASGKAAYPSCPPFPNQIVSRQSSRIPHLPPLKVPRFFSGRGFTETIGAASNKGGGGAVVVGVAGAAATFPSDPKDVDGAASLPCTEEEVRSQLHAWGVQDSCLYSHAWRRVQELSLPGRSVDARADEWKRWMPRVTQSRRKQGDGVPMMWMSPPAKQIQYSWWKSSE